MFFFSVSAAATSQEFSPEAECPVIVYMPEISKTHLGGTMRLGLRSTLFSEGTESWSKIRKLYGGEQVIWERHRHRYEVGAQYIERLEKSGLNFVGRDDKGERMQIFELQGVQLAPIRANGR
jgi:CTP synthase